MTETTNPLPVFRVILTGGGTGGHLYPALAVAEGLQQHFASQPAQSLQLLYVGNQTSIEAEKVPPTGIPFEGIYFHGMPRSKKLLHRIMATLGWSIELIQAIRQSYDILKRFQPHVVFGTGGYVSAPVLMAAALRRIPVVIHEPDAYPGLVNQLTSRWSSAVTMAFEEAQSRLKAPLTATQLVSGNPLRAQMGQYTHTNAFAQIRQLYGKSWSVENTEKKRPLLLVMGGSQGAQTLNQAVLEGLPHWIDTHGYRVIHQTGAKLFDAHQAQLPERFRDHPDYLCQPFFTQMGALLSVADIAICRAGSLTLSELFLSGLPAILVPYPYAAANHQLKNAQATAAHGAAVVLEDKNCHSAGLNKLLYEILQDESRLTQMRQAAKALAKPQATDTIVQLLLSQRLR